MARDKEEIAQRNDGNRRGSPDDRRKSQLLGEGFEAAVDGGRNGKPQLRQGLVTGQER